MKKIVSVNGMTCGHCKMAVENALNDLAGVSNAEVNLEAKEATIEAADDVTEAAIESAIDSTGFEFAGIA